MGLVLDDQSLKMALRFLSVLTVVFLFVCPSVYGSAHSLFNIKDTNNNDCLEEDEFVAIWKSMDRQPPLGQLSLQEFRDGWKRDKFNDQNDVTYFFIEMDRNHDVHIDEEEMKQMFLTFDTSNDGCVTLKEYDFNWDSLFNEHS